MVCASLPRLTAAASTVCLERQRKVAESERYASATCQPHPSHHRCVGQLQPHVAVDQRRAERRETCLFETCPDATSALTQRFDSLWPLARMHLLNDLLPTGCALQYAK